MSTMPDDNTFLSSAGRHKRKRPPVKKPFSIQTLLIIFALILIALSFFLGDGDNNANKTDELSRLEIKKPGLTNNLEKSSINNSVAINVPSSMTTSTQIAEIGASENIATESLTAENLLEGEHARNFIKTALGNGQQTPDSIFEQAEALRKAMKYTDAWLLYFYAARQGHAPSSVSLASMSDPNTYQKFGSPLNKGDEFQALKWYSLASKQGDTASIENFTKFKKLLENKAKSGDTHSRQLLLQIGTL